MDGLLPETLGLTTREALQRLRADIAQFLQHHRDTTSRSRFLRDIISISSEKVLLSGVAYSVTFLYILFLILTYIVGKSVQADFTLLLQALLLFIILIANFVLAVHEDHLRRTELPNRVRHVLTTLDEAIKTAEWNEENYPHLCAPLSPCVTLQWSYRDGALVNLPWALLVNGDVIVVRPGQELPGRCAPLNSGNAQHEQQQNPAKEKLTIPTVREPHQNKAYRMLETPYLHNLRMALEQAQDRPLTKYNKQRYFVTVRLMEGVVLPLVICLVVIASVFRHVYSLPGAEGALWTEVYLLNMVAATLPLLQIIFPLAWVGLNCYGIARFKLLSETKQAYTRSKSCSLSEDARDPLLDVLLDSDVRRRQKKRLARIWLNILLGREDMVTRTANIVHVLGSLSALCCVDKKGILSWPNPTAEKVFFLRKANPMSRSSSKTSLGQSEEEAAEAGNTKQNDKHKHHADTATVAEVLDLTHDQNAPFSVEFDDHAWRQHLARLKPLGLAALLNTCAPAPRHLYSHLCAHLACEAQLSDDLVPVANRRCLCELAKQIGFQEQATTLYSVKESLAVFRHLQADTIRREKRFARSLHLSTKVKVPLPHMLSTVVSDPFKRLQLLSQGTADIILDGCVDYWNGSDLTPLTASDRKKVLDFYQRSSLGAYCTAFAYKPLTRGISREIAQTYLQLPANYRLPPDQQCDPTHFHSTDSLLLNGAKEEDVNDAQGFYELQSNQVFLGMVTMQYQAQSDMVELVERLERACIRFVHFSKENELRSRVFSEKMGLESGWNCHISLMSEPPVSKPASPVSSQLFPSAEKRASNRCNNKPVFSDKDCMGDMSYFFSNMETSKPLSMSAPGAINVELTTVKFDNETKRARHSIPANNDEKTALNDSGPPSATSLLEVGDTEADSPLDACRSLSCLTDSTDRSVPLNFDTSNRAKLPRGIDNIRPHIEQVDNVPLLVSLFTDCTATSARSMLRIMQDYGEVVCVMGSAANRDNMHIFMQADASIAVEPLYPVVCQKLPPYLAPQHCPGPIDLARTLNAISCSMSGPRDSDVSLFSLITMSRHLMTSLWNATQFWMCCVSSISFLQVCALLGLLPVCLTAGAALWLCALVVPALSGALVLCPLDPAVMHSAGAHARLSPTTSPQVIVFVLWCYGLKFVPAALSVLALYAATLRSFCQQIVEVSNSTSCHYVYPVHNSTQPGASARSWTGDFYDGYYLAQHLALVLVTLHLIVISISFVDRNASLWQKGFWVNKAWCVTVLFVLVAQCVYTGSSVSRRYCRGAACHVAYRLPWSLGTAYAVSLLLVCATNELVKWQEIKANVRYQRRARLDFGTKLGMNSPF